MGDQLKNKKVLFHIDKNELLKNPPLLLNLSWMVWYVCALVVCILGQFSEALSITTRKCISYTIKFPNDMLTLN
jgi:hypothetical protein